MSRNVRGEEGKKWQIIWLCEPGRLKISRKFEITQIADFGWLRMTLVVDLGFHSFQQINNNSTNNPQSLQLFFFPFQCNSSTSIIEFSVTTLTRAAFDVIWISLESCWNNQLNSQHFFPFNIFIILSSLFMQSRVIVSRRVSQVLDWKCEVLAFKSNDSTVCCLKVFFGWICSQSFSEFQLDSKETWNFHSPCCIVKYKGLLLFIVLSCWFKHSIIIFKTLNFNNTFDSMEVDSSHVH